jgi:hypothetical protein
MNVVIVGVERTSAHLAALLHDGCVLRVVPDAATAVLEHGRQPIQLIIVAATPRAEDAIDTVRALRGHLRGGPSDPAIWVDTERASDDWLQSVFHAGAEAELRQPYSGPTLLARIQAYSHRYGPSTVLAPAPVPERRVFGGPRAQGGFPLSPPSSSRPAAVSAVPRAAAPMMALPAATAAPAASVRTAPPAPERSPIRPSMRPPATASPTRPPAGSHGVLDQMVETPTWLNVAQIAARSASTFLAQQVNVGAALYPSARQDYAVAIKLVSPENNIEARIAISGDRRSAAALATGVFGEAGEELERDVLAELSNILMGTLKTEFKANGFPFTAGLPERLDPAKVIKPDEFFRLETAFTLVPPDAILQVHIGVRSKDNQFFTTQKLREGMVLAKDVHNNRGILIIGRGTRLSENMIAHLGRLVPADQLLEVMSS